MAEFTGRTAIVTGATRGIGRAVAESLLRYDCSVVGIYGSNHEEAKRFQDNWPAGQLSLYCCNVADHDQVQRFYQDLEADFEVLDILINNAGIMRVPFGKTADGFELHIGTNHLGHFALTGLLLDLIVSTPHARIVTLSSMAHRFGRIDFDNLNSEKGYRSNAAYGQSKLANLLFTYELQRRLQAGGNDTIAVAAHPGWTATNLQQNSGVIRFFNRFLAQTPAMGALPTLRAATAPDVQGGDYYGPSKRMEMVGYPKKVGSSGRSHDTAVAAELWTVSEEMTGVQYNLGLTGGDA